MVNTKTKVTIATNIVKPPSQILNSLQGSNLNIYIVSPYLSYGRKYQAYLPYSDQLMLKKETLPINNPRTMEIIKVSKMEDLSFLVSVQPLQYTNSPAIDKNRYTHKGCKFTKKIRIASNMLLILIHYTLNSSSF